MLFLIPIILIGIIALLIYLFFTWNFNYWIKRNVNGPEPKLFVGNFPSAVKGDRNIIYDFWDYYRQYKGKEKFIGVFLGRDPQLVVLSPDLVHEVYVTKFRNFYDNFAGHIYDEKYDEVFGLNPFFLTGQKWKHKRAEVTPALTMNRIKASHPVMTGVGLKLVDFIKAKIQRNGKNCDIDAKELCQRYTVQTVSDCVYGVDAGALNLNSDSLMLETARHMIDDFMAGFEKLFLLKSYPLISNFFNINFLGKSTKLFFKQLMYDAIDLRKKNQNDRVDFLNYIMQLKEKKGLTENEMLAHFMSFFGDGFETSATTLAVIMLCLGRNPDKQAKLRAEIEANCAEDGTIPFDKLHELEYLNCCFYEALRLFSVLTYVSKICTEETTLTNYDGRTLLVQKGTVINMPTYCFHNDEEYFINPEKYEPERFHEEMGGEKKYRDMGCYAPFGDGPRMCLGQKFGITQVKSGLCEIIRNFEIKISERTRKDNLLCSKTILASLDGGIWLQFKNLKD